MRLTVPLHRLGRLLMAAVGMHVTTSTLSAQEAGSLIKKGEVYDKKLDNARALDFYLAAEKLAPEDCQLQCKIARNYRGLMMDADSKNEKIELGKIALQHAQQAVELNPNSADAHLSVAISYGKLMPSLPKQEQVEASPLLKKSVDKAIALDPSNDLAWHVLGKWHRVLADVSGLKRALAGAIYGGLPKGSNEEAAKCLEKAVALNPSRPMHYIELGRTYAQMGRDEDARKVLLQGLALPDTEKDDPEAKAHGRETLAQLR